MAFETPEQRAKRLGTEAAFRQANIKRYEKAMKVELPYSPVAVVERPAAGVNVNSDLEGSGVNVNSDRKAYLRDYMRKYRKREKKCPHCGGAL